MSIQHFVLLINVTASLVIFAGTAYIVFWMGHSAWWFLLAVFLNSVTQHEVTPVRVDK